MGLLTSPFVVVIKLDATKFPLCDVLHGHGSL